MIDNNIVNLINRRENQLLVHSALYYEFNKNIISDDLYDKWSFELKDLIETYPDEFSASDNYESFLNFDPSSGYYLNYTDKVDRAACLYNDYCRLHNIDDYVNMETLEDHKNRLRRK